MKWIKASNRWPSESGFFYIRSAWGKDIWNFIVDHSGGKWYNGNSAWAYNDIEWLDESESEATCYHCGDVIEHPLCRSCDVSLTLPTEEY